jgi:hypothetical protein
MTDASRPVDRADDARPDPGDVEADPKARAALSRFSLRSIRASTDPAFAGAFAALSSEFAPRGELERREVIDGWLDRPDARTIRTLTGVELVHEYHFITARDESGKLAGVRDCHVTVDREARVAVAYLAHALVMPQSRRSGLAALLRAAPVTIARRVVNATLAGAANIEILLAAEMEHPQSLALESVTRLVAYGRAGFRALSPRHFPYHQPDFRSLAAPATEPVPLPLLALVRSLGHDDDLDLPARLADAFATHLYAVFATHCDRLHLRTLLAFTSSTLAASGLQRLPLLRLPSSPDDGSALDPLYRDTVLPFYEIRSEV